MLYYKEGILMTEAAEQKKKYFKGLSKREYIIKAGEIIAHEGINAVSVRRIAKAIGCTSANLYRYFDNLDQLLYFAELRTLKDYIVSLNEMQQRQKNCWGIYVGVWDCYCKEAFSNPEAYNLLFFNNKLESVKKIKSAWEEYYQMFPEELSTDNHCFRLMLQATEFMKRDYEICKICIDDGALTVENAVILNRMVCMLYKGYFKTVYDERPSVQDIQRYIRNCIDDIDRMVIALASDLKGYSGYYNG